jgi:DinB superfamily
MSRKNVLFQIIEENTHYMHDVLDNSPAAALYWTPDGQGNDIAVTIWHVARACDVFLTLHVRDQEAEQEVWFTEGYAGQTGYDPRGIGTHGWGQITGYTAAEVQAIPRMESAVLKGYFDAVLSAVRAYLDETPDAVLDEKAPGYEGRQTNWFWISHPLFDMTRHVGEILALKGMWERMA